MLSTFCHCVCCQANARVCAGLDVLHGSSSDRLSLLLCNSAPIHCCAGFCLRHTRLSRGRYVSGRFGFFYYDGFSATGFPKPIAHATRFLRTYLDEVGPGSEDIDGWTNSSRYALKLVPVDVPKRLDGSSNNIGGAFTFTGPDCLFVGGHGQTFTSDKLNVRGCQQAHCKERNELTVPTSLRVPMHVGVGIGTNAALEIQDHE